MSQEIQHTPEHLPPRPAGLPASASWCGDRERAQAVRERELAAAYYRTFTSADGQKVLADLLRKFSPHRPRFKGHSDPIQAARIDGEGNVLLDIESAIAAGSPNLQ